MQFKVKDDAACTALGVTCDDVGGEKHIKIGTATGEITKEAAYKLLKEHGADVSIKYAAKDNAALCGQPGVECTYATPGDSSTDVTQIKWADKAPAGWKEYGNDRPAWLPEPTSFGNFAATPGASTPGDELLTDANKFIGIAETALDAIGELRSAIGAVQNRLEHTYNNLSNMVGNTTESSGRIMDVDYASESEHMSQQQILMQASTAMLKQASTMNQMVLSLVQG